MSVSSENIQLSISFSQLLDIVSQLPSEQKKKLMDLLQKQTYTEMNVPEDIQQMVQERLEKYRKNPEGSSDWDDFEKELDKL